MFKAVREFITGKPLVKAVEQHLREADKYAAVDPATITPALLNEALKEVVDIFPIGPDDYHYFLAVASFHLKLKSDDKLRTDFGDAPYLRDYLMRYVVELARASNHSVEDAANVAPAVLDEALETRPYRQQLLGALGLPEIREQQDRNAEAFVKIKTLDRDLRAQRQGRVKFPLAACMRKFSRLTVDEQKEIIADSEKLTTFLEESGFLVGTEALSRDVSRASTASTGTATTAGLAPLGKDASTPGLSLTGTSTLMDKNWARDKREGNMKIRGSRNSRRGVPSNYKATIGNRNKSSGGWCEAPAAEGRLSAKLAVLEDCKAQKHADFAVN
eukprot:NODE_503_length_1337_cov_430.219720_g363_i0.p1 GENE.NODE_503_length_1337_cov_430.219720_g363_i0~~NODE_503_length_1337_cov_430.219720_g363_i0.p1  ORF type:complete len:330 (+),score=132.44 NODE_503_length_1337_cov_430.219720_g363_i0:116-1105(+)